ncbi:hypothetical protein [Isoptericola croceus]|uniref:hypothetical protein n=1 Tax=Isoptericola croceus TaxID=3031406 RepID=UPI0023F75041|nr:hypothetical protein [Isoptericola croceus]
MRKTCSIPGRSLAALVVDGLLGTGAADAAMASRTGSEAQSTSNKLISRDTKADDKSTRAIGLLPSGAETSVTNKSGANSSASGNASGIEHVKACISRTALPMACTAWNQHL